MCASPKCGGNTDDQDTWWKKCRSSENKLNAEGIARAKISQVLEKEIEDPKKKKLYEFTGKKSRQELSDLTGLSTGTISGIWQTRHSKGILKKQGKSYVKLVEEEVTEDG